MDAAKWNRNKKTQFRVFLKKIRVPESLPLREVLIGSLKLTGDRDAVTLTKEIRTQALATIAEIIRSKIDAMAARETRSGTRKVLP